MSLSSFVPAGRPILSTGLLFLWLSCQSCSSCLYCLHQPFVPKGRSILAHRFIGGFPDAPLLLRPGGTSHPVYVVFICLSTRQKVTILQTRCLRRDNIFYTPSRYRAIATLPTPVRTAPKKLFVFHTTTIVGNAAHKNKLSCPTAICPSWTSNEGSNNADKTVTGTYRSQAITSGGNGLEARSSKGSKRGRYVTASMPSIMKKIVCCSIVQGSLQPLPQRWLPQSRSNAVSRIAKAQRRKFRSAGRQSSENNW